MFTAFLPQKRVSIYWQLFALHFLIFTFERACLQHPFVIKVGPYLQLANVCGQYICIDIFWWPLSISATTQWDGSSRQMEKIYFINMLKEFIFFVINSQRNADICQPYEVTKSETHKYRL